MEDNGQLGNWNNYVTEMGNKVKDEIFPYCKFPLSRCWNWKPKRDPSDREDGLIMRKLHKLVVQDHPCFNTEKAWSNGLRKVARRVLSNCKTSATQKIKEKFEGKSIDGKARSEKNTYYFIHN